MIYLDTSVALAELFAEDRKPPASLWQGPLISSRLLEYELFTRVHALGHTASHAEAARDLLTHVSFLELHPLALARALDPFPQPVRTLDALHLASLVFLRSRGMKLSLATYDRRMLATAHALKIPLHRLDE
ncbi:MAG TPA: PIN domain-containing protein [Polyangia bacterium]|jgi:predicted nucleic acid-binding protein